MTRSAYGAASALALAITIPTAAAETAAERPWRVSAGVGGATLVTGHGGDRWRLDVVLDVKPASRYGALVAWRAIDEAHRGLVLGGLIYEAGAARPRLVIDLHGDAGLDLDAGAPALGGGIRSTIGVWGPLGVALDTSAHLVLDGVDDARIQLAFGARAALRW